LSVPVTTTRPGEREFSESEVRTIALALIGGMVLGGVATGVAFPTLPLLDEILGISAVMLGVILSANRIVRLPLSTPAGGVIDRYGARKPIIVGLFVQALAPFGYLLGINVPVETLVALPYLGDVSTPAAVFVAARAVWGVGSVFTWLGAFATITYVTTQRNRGKWLGYMGGGQALGFPTGLVVGGFAADLFSPGVAFLVAGVLALLGGAIALVVLPGVQPETESTASIRDIPAMVRREPRVLPIGAGQFTMRFLFDGILLATLAKYAEAFDVRFTLLSAAGISGLVLAVGVLSSGATTFVSGRISDQLSNRALVTVPAFLAMAVGMGILAVSPTMPGLVAATALVGIGTGATGPALSATLGDITPDGEIGRMSGVTTLIGDVGFMLGPLLAVPMVDVWLGFRTTYWLCVALVLVTLVAVAVPLLTWETGLVGGEPLAED
jgi:MFS family permease